MRQRQRRAASLAADLRALRVLLMGRRRGFAVGMVISVASVLVGLSQPWLLSRTVQLATDGRAVAGMILLLALTFLVQMCLDAAGRAVLLRSGEAAILQIRKRLLARVLRLPMRSYESNRLGDLLTRATADAVLLRIASPSISRSSRQTRR